MSVLRGLPVRLDSHHGTGIARAQQRQGFSISSFPLSALRRSRLPVPPRVSSPSSASTSPEKKPSNRKPQNSEGAGAGSAAKASFAVDPAARSRGDQPSRSDPHIDTLRARQHVPGGDFLVSERSSTCGGRIVVALDDTENAALAVKWVAEHLFDPGARNAGPLADMHWAKRTRSTPEGLQPAVYLGGPGLSRSCSVTLSQLLSSCARKEQVPC